MATAKPWLEHTSWGQTSVKCQAMSEDMKALELLFDLHKDQDRQGPGCAAVTRKAIELAGLDSSQPLRIADLGCGSGASTLVLAQELNAQITAVDFAPLFLDKLKVDAERLGLNRKIEIQQGSMDELTFAPAELDVIWSEGAIYNLGFERGVQYCHGFLKPGGVLAVSEATWLTAERPDEIHQWWTSQYDGIATAAEQIQILESNGYALEAYFVEPEHCWMENYYQPLQQSFDDFLAKHNHGELAKEIIEGHVEEIAMYQKYKQYYSYGFYIAKKLG